MPQYRRISQNEDFSLVAQSIVDNMELWRVDSEKKAQASITKQLENIEKRETYYAKCSAEFLLSQKDTDQSQSRGYNLGHGRSTGD